MDVDMRPSAVLTRALARLGPNGGNVVRNWTHTVEDDAGGAWLRFQEPTATRWCILGALWTEGDFAAPHYNNGPARRYAEAALGCCGTAAVWKFRSGEWPWERIESAFVVAIGMAHADEEAAVAKEAAHV